MRSVAQDTPSQRERGIRHSRQVKTPAAAYAGPGPKPQPSEEEAPETDPCRHHRTASTATTPMPSAATATTRRVRRAALHGSIPRTLQGRPTNPLYRRCPGHQFVRTPPDADKRLAAEERISRRNPTPQHPQNAANLIAHRRRTSPPDQSRKCSRWGRPGFRRPASNWTPGRPVRAAQPPHVGQGESQANPSRAAPLQDGRQTAAARRKRFRRFAPSRINPDARPMCARRTSGRQCRGANRLNPVMKVPCRNRPHLLPTARWSGGRAGRRRCDEAEGGGECVGGCILREGGEEQERQQYDERGETGAKGCPIVLGTIRLIPPETPARAVLHPFHPPPPVSRSTSKPPESGSVLCRLLNFARSTAALRRPRRINWHVEAIEAQLRGLCRLSILCLLAKFIPVRL